MKALGCLGILLALAISTPVGAVSTSYDTDAVSTGATGSTLYNALWCNSSGCTATDKTGVSGYAKLTAWSTTTMAAANAAPSDTGAWMAAKLAVYVGGGIGITSMSGGQESTSSPEHAIDNKGLDDILVVDFGSTGWDVNSFALGWTGNSQTTATGGTVAVEAWVGNTFSSAGFLGTNNMLSQLPSGGFTRLTLNPDPVGPNTLIADCTNPVAPCNTTGQYLIIAGALGPGSVGDLGTGTTGYNDAFKVKEIVATKTPGGPGGNQIPAPGSLVLLAFGLLVMTYMRRRAAVRA